MRLYHRLLDKVHFTHNEPYLLEVVLSAKKSFISIQEYGANNLPVRDDNLNEATAAVIRSS